MQYDDKSFKNLKPYADKLDERISDISTIKHRAAFESKHVHPLQSASNRSSSKAHDFLTKMIENMLAINVIKPAQT